MSTRHPANIPVALSRARRQLDRWRSRQRDKRTRLPEELWQKAVILAREHGLKKTACAPGLKYYSLKKRLDETSADELGPLKIKPDFIELPAGAMTPGCVECMIGWADGRGATVRMHIRGAACRGWPLWRACTGRPVAQQPSF